MFDQIGPARSPRMPSRTEEQKRRAIEGAGSQSRAPCECRVAHAPDALPRLAEYATARAAAAQATCPRYRRSLQRCCGSPALSSRFPLSMPTRSTGILEGQVKLNGRFRRSSEASPLRRSLNFSPLCFWAQFGHGTQPSRLNWSTIRNKGARKAVATRASS